VVIAVSVVAILTGLAVPAIDSVQRERLAREPVNRLILLAREVRGRAMTEQRPYQIMFDGEGLFVEHLWFYGYAAESRDSDVGEFDAWVETVDRLVGQLAAPVQQRFWRDTAKRVYRLG
jgi:Tfp pilus assembly protein FimT